MKIKTKLNLGVGLLFVLILILSLVGAYYIFSIKKDTENILKANYNTLEYSRNMLLSLDEINIDQAKSISVFESNLQNQIDNITEAGEGIATQNLKKNFLIFEIEFYSYVNLNFLFIFSLSRTCKFEISKFLRHL